MNEETKNPEPLAAILAEMRRFAAFAAGRSRITPAPSLAAEQEGHAAQLAKYADHPVKVPAGAFAWLFAPAEGVKE